MQVSLPAFLHQSNHFFPHFFFGDINDPGYMTFIHEKLFEFDLFLFRHVGSEHDDMAKVEATNETPTEFIQFLLALLCSLLTVVHWLKSRQTKEFFL
jgi:hypothetical protein